MKVSDGCKNCYAETLAYRYGKKIWGSPKTTNREYKSGIWKDLLKWDTEAGKDEVRRRVFVSSMADFLEDHPQVVEWRKRAMGMIEGLKNLDILLLSKRPENANVFLSSWYSSWPSHVWIGTTVENQKAADERLHHLLAVPSPVHFLSVEPMLEKIDLDLSGRNYGRDFPTYSESVQWVICGGESGVGCRPFSVEWARDLLLQCNNANVPFWMKQLGGHPNKYHNLEDLPADLQVRELPELSTK